jgi:hypothetical protein
VHRWLPRPPAAQSLRFVAVRIRIAVEQAFLFDQPAAPSRVGVLLMPRSAVNELVHRGLGGGGTSSNPVQRRAVPLTQGGEGLAIGSLGGRCVSPVPPRSSTVAISGP